MNTAEPIRRKFTFVIEDHAGDRLTVSMAVDPPVQSADEEVTPASIFAAGVIEAVKELAEKYGTPPTNPERN